MLTQYATCRRCSAKAERIRTQVVDRTDPVGLYDPVICARSDTSSVVQGPPCRMSAGKGVMMTRGNDVVVAVPLTQFRHQFGTNLSGCTRHQNALHTLSLRRCALPCPLDHEIAAVDIQRRPGDVGGSIGGRKATSSATSKGSPKRLIGKPVGVCLGPLGADGRPLPSRYRSGPGQTAMTVMPYPATSLARWRVKPRMPALAAV